MSLDDEPVCYFPEHDGEFWSDVVEDDRPYVMWIVGGEGPKMTEDLYNYLMELLEDTQ